MITIWKNYLVQSTELLFKTDTHSISCEISDCALDDVKAFYDVDLIEYVQKLIPNLVMYKQPGMYILELIITNDRLIKPKLKPFKEEKI